MKFLADNFFGFLLIIGLVAIAWGTILVIREETNKAKCNDYQKLHTNIKTEWISSYGICINSKTKKQINLMNL